MRFFKIVPPLPDDTPGCSFTPSKIVDEDIESCCVRHDRAYRSGEGGILAKIKSDFVLFANIFVYALHVIFVHGVLEILKGIWFLIYSILVFVALSVAGYFAYYYYRPNTKVGKFVNFIYDSIANRFK